MVRRLEDRGWKVIYSPLYGIDIMVGSYQTKYRCAVHIEQIKNFAMLTLKARCQNSRESWRPAVAICLADPSCFDKIESILINACINCECLSK